MARSSVRRVLWAVIGACFTGAAYAGTMLLAWVPPTTNTDGTPLTDLAQYAISWRCGAGSGYPNSRRINAPASSYLLELPDDGQECTAVVSAVNAKGTESAFSNAVSKRMPLPPRPGNPTQAPSVSWREYVSMAVAYDAFGSNTASGYATTFNFTPSGTPRGIIVFILTDTTNPATAVTYGGVSMSSVIAADGPGSGENPSGRMSAWFLGSGIPTGTRSIVVTGPPSGSPTITVVSVTAGGDVEVIDSDAISSASVSNPSNTLTTGGRTVFAAISGISGVDAVGNITPLANWTSRQEEDYGTVTQFTYTFNTIGTSNVTAGVTQAADDMLMVSIAVSEVVAGTGAVRLVDSGIIRNLIGGSMVH